MQTQENLVLKYCACQYKLIDLIRQLCNTLLQIHSTHHNALQFHIHACTIVFKKQMLPMTSVIVECDQWCRKVSDQRIWLTKFHSDWQKILKHFCCIFYCTDKIFKISPNDWHVKKSRCVCETLQYAPGSNKVPKAIFSFKVKVKVTRLLTLMPFERASLVEYACQIWSLYLLWFKIYSEG